MSTGTRPKWVDFHCHLDLYPNHTTLIRECDEKRVATLAVTTTPKAWRRNLQLASASSCVRVGLGLHPQLVAERGAEISLLEQYLPEARYVGEVGLDAGPRFYTSLPQQERVFERVLRLCAEQGNKILSIHSVRTAGKVLQMLEKHLPRANNRVVLHWFTGSLSEAKRAIEYGCYFSVNSDMFSKPSGVKLITSLPSDRILTETDGPFTSVGGRPSTPADVQLAVTLVAKAHNLSDYAAAAKILSNLRTLVS